jgi:hypothetical protein
MTEIVRDSDGQLFVLDTSGWSNADAVYSRPSLRAVLDRRRSVGSIVSDLGNRDALAWALVTIGACRSDEGPRLTLEQLQPLVTQALASGAIRLVSHEPDFRPIFDMDFEALSEPLMSGYEDEEEEIRATHTIELELLGEDDAPIPGEPYRVELPDGQVIEGRLNALGRALVTGIARAGTCEVTFPRLDEGAWTRI